MAEPSITYSPWAEMYVVKSFSGLDQPTGTDTSFVAVQDIVSLTVNLSVDSPGAFTAVLDNKNDRYMIADDPEAETKRLYAASEDSKKLAKDQLGADVLPTEAGTYYPYKTRDEFLDFENAVVVGPDRRFPVYFRREGRAGTSIITGVTSPYPVTNAWWFDDQEELQEITQELWEAEEFRANGKNYRIEKHRNREFFERYGGSIRRGRCIFSPMDRVVLYMSRRFQKKGEPRLIRVFTGLVNSVDDQYGENNTQVQIQGEDVTKWMRISYANVNPALLQMDDLNVQKTIKYFTNIFAGYDGSQIIKALCLGTHETERADSTIEWDLEGIGTYTLESNHKTGLPVGISGAIAVEYDSRDINEGGVVTDQAAREIFQASRLRLQDPSKYDLDEFAPFKRMYQSGWDFWQSEYKTRLDLAREVAQATNFVFYADPRGNIHYHQPRFDNVHILGAAEPRVFVLDDMSIQSWTFVESDGNIITRLYASTEDDYFGGILTEVGENRAWYQDDALVVKYGLRIFTVSDPLIRGGMTEGKQNPDVYYYAKSRIQRINADRLNGSITLTGRAELIPDYPIYVPSRNMIYYVSSVSHSFNWAGTYSTTVGLKYGRKPWDILPELLDYQTSIVQTASDVVGQTTPQSTEGKDYRLLDDLEVVVVHQTGMDSATSVDDLVRAFGGEDEFPFDVVLLPQNRILVSKRWARDQQRVFNNAWMGSYENIIGGSSKRHNLAAERLTPGSPLASVHVAVHGDMGGTKITIPQYTGLFVDLMLYLHNYTGKKLSWTSIQLSSDILPGTDAGDQVRLWKNTILWDRFSNSLTTQTARDEFNLGNRPGSIG